MQSQTEISNGIADYAHEQKVVRRIIRKHGVLTAEQFDRIFTNIVTRRGVLFMKKRHPYFLLPTGRSFILGGMNGRLWAKFLELTQLMADCGIVGITKSCDTYEYRLN